MEVVTFKEVGIGTITMESRVICRGDSFMEDYIYNRWSRSLAKNIFWEEGKTSFLIYFVDSKINHKGGSFPSPSTSPPQTPVQRGFLLQ